MFSSKFLTVNLLAMAGIVFVLLLTGLVYWQGLSGPYLLDDVANVVRFYVPDFNYNDILYAVTHNRSGILGRPVSMISLVLSGILHGPESWGYKFHNLLIHILNGLLIFWLLIKILPIMVSSISKEKVLFVALTTMSLWLLHPLMVSTVLYVVQRMAQLSTFFTLLALLVYIIARESLIKGNFSKFYILAYLAFPVLMLLALFSKENGALIPIYIIAIEMLVYKFDFSPVRIQKHIMTFLGVFVALPILLGSFYFFTHIEQFINYTNRDFNLLERLMTQLHAVVFYIKLIFLPRLADMSLFHDDAEVIRQMDILTTLLLMIMLLAIASVFYFRKKAPVFAFAIAWFIISHLVESTFIGLELIFEHRNYLAAMGPILALVYYLSSIPEYPKLKYGCLLFLVFWTFLTSTRVTEWRSDDLFYQVAIEEHPTSLRANTEFATLNFNRGDIESAFFYLKQAQQADNREMGSFVHEILLRCDTGEDMSELVNQVENRLSQYPISTYTINTFDALLGKKRISECPEVPAEKIIELTQIASNHEVIQNRQTTLGYIERLQGLAYMYSGNYQEGVNHLLQAYELTRLASILMELVNIQIQISRYEDAEHLLKKLDEINDASFGIETSRLQVLKDAFSEALNVRQEQMNN